VKIWKNCGFGETSMEFGPQVDNFNFSLVIFGRPCSFAGYMFIILRHVGSRGTHSSLSQSNCKSVGWTLCPNSNELFSVTQSTVHRTDKELYTEQRRLLAFAASSAAVLAATSQSFHASLWCFWYDRPGYTPSITRLLVPAPSLGDRRSEPNSVIAYHRSHQAEQPLSFRPPTSQTEVNETATDVISEVWRTTVLYSPGCILPPRYDMVIWTSSFSMKTRPVRRLCLRWVAWELEPSLNWCPAWKTLFQWKRISPLHFRSTGQHPGWCWHHQHAATRASRDTQRLCYWSLRAVCHIPTSTCRQTRLDIVWDLYMADILKAVTRSKRGKRVVRDESSHHVQFLKTGESFSASTTTFLAFEHGRHWH